MSDEIMVSVICLAFNHEKYIGQALESFVCQKTSFKYEVIVHDDASSDSTGKIIREYAELYPDIIKPIIQSENQHSKGIPIIKTYVTPSLSPSKYYALCEGDDYWTDKHKLQKQYDYMERNSDCSMCVHNTKIVSESGYELHKKVNSNVKDINYEIADIIRAGGGGLFHTSSFFWRSEYGIVNPKEFVIKGIGDYSKAIYLSTKGHVHYIGETMSAYRQNAIGSWSSRLAEDEEKEIQHCNNLISGLSSINNVTDQKYDLPIRFAIKNAEYRICIIKRKYRLIFADKELRNIFVHKPLKHKFKLFLKMLFRC